MGGWDGYDLLGDEEGKEGGRREKAGVGLLRVITFVIVKDVMAVIIIGMLVIIIEDGGGGGGGEEGRP